MKISGKALKRHRTKIDGLRQEDIANSLGMTRPNYNTWENKAWIEVTEKQAKALEKSLHVSIQDLTIEPKDEGSQGNDILDHPVIKSLVNQSEYIMKRVTELEEENRRLRGQKN